jgi:hypothetical protein
MACLGKLDRQGQGMVKIGTHAAVKSFRRPDSFANKWRLVAQDSEPCIEKPANEYL